MIRKFIFTIISCLIICIDVHGSQNLAYIAEKIWRNECGGTIDGLTTWNKGESFASLGIGHFIWYPKGKKEHFEETFPNLIYYLMSRGAHPPDWLQNSPTCPWQTREAFYQNINHEHMQSLRKYLFDTKDLQAEFITKRLDKALSTMLNTVSPQEKNRIKYIYSKLYQDKKGLYALMDYVNFKGVGVSPAETYAGQGWGLLQVLQGMPLDSKISVEDFTNSARKVLTLRVKNAPPDRHEERWLKGWFNRIDTYLAD